MAKTTLRAYDREIESLIEQNQYEQAIAHARHILKFFPKHIQTYRLLGKSYLESQRYGDAADVFQRVLSAIPDDFVSHVGMSIIREDEGNLDDAIWHMERAFEIQPANSAIQGELRRLYGRRDGMEPPKVRLTRGALARMYLKGELYQQAIAELRAALGEDPQRPDLLSMLAQAYFTSGQRVEAADTCSTLLKKAPYCMEANRILAEILVNTERADEAQIYRQRVNALDPYAAQLSPAAPTPDKVPDSAISLEKLVWSPGQPVMGLPGQPEWAASLGVDLGTAPPEKESFPDWLADQSGKTPAFEAELGAGEGISPFAEPGLPSEIAEPAQSEEAIPEWMKEVGWEPPSGTGQQPPALFEDSGIATPPQEELAPADIPEWLQAISPREGAQPEGLEEAPGDEAGLIPPSELPPSESDALSWLQETPPGPTDSVVTWLEEEQPAAPVSAGIEMEAGESAEIPDWLKDLAQAEPGTPEETETMPMPAIQETREVPAFEETAGPTEWQTGESAVDEGVSLGELPDWLKDLKPGEELEAAPAAELPDWLADTKKEEWQPEEAVESLPASIQAETPVETAPASLDDDAAFAWLEGLAAKQGADEAMLLKPEERREEPPDWVKEAATEVPIEPASTPPEEVSTLPDWLQGEAPIQPLTEELAAVETGDETASWLQEVESQPIETQAEPEISEAVFPIEVPEVSIEEPALPGEGLPEEAEIPAFEETLQTGEPSAAEPGELPDWLREMGALTTRAEVTEADILAVPAGEPEEPEAEIGELPSWLSEIKPETGEAVESSQLPEWLSGIKPSAEGQVPEWLAEEKPPLEAEAAAAGLPDWLAETKPPHEAEAEAAVLPDWLSEAKPETETAEVPSWLPESSSKAGEPEEAVEPPGWITGSEAPVEKELELEMLFGPQIMAAVEPAPSVEEPKAVEVEPVVISDTQPTRVRPPEEIAPQPVEAELPPSEPAPAEVPEWLQGMGEEAKPEEEAPGEPVPGVPGVSIDDDAAFAWLESLAARMGADEALLLKPEERSEVPPEWVQKAAEEAGELPIEMEGPVEMAPSLEITPPEEIAPVELPIEAVFMGTEEILPVEEPLLETPSVEVFTSELEGPQWAETVIPEEPSSEAVTSELQGYPPIEEPAIGTQTPEEALVEPAVESFEPVAEMGVEEAAVAREEAPPELPSWLAGVEAVEVVEEGAGWTPPEEQPKEEAAVLPAGESLYEAEPFQLAETEAVQLDLNQAGLAELERLPGVGFTRAQAIITYRQAFGPFSSVDELSNVAGFDLSLVDSLRDKVSLPEILPVEPMIEGVDIHQMTLIQARNALIQGESTKALSHYTNLIKARQMLPEVIQDLNEALYRFPIDISIWEALGDAHLRSGHLQSALDAYTKAEELIR